MLCKCVELILSEIPKILFLIENGSATLKKIVLRIFYIEYFSTFSGDFTPIEVGNGWLRCLTRNPSLSCSGDPSSTTDCIIGRENPEEKIQMF
jgi:hypothetical protein